MNVDSNYVEKVIDESLCEHTAIVNGKLCKYIEIDISKVATDDLLKLVDDADEKLKCDIYYELAKRDRSSNEYWYDLAYCLINLKRFEEVHRVIDRVARIFQKDGKYYLYKAYLFYNEEKIDDAKYCLDESKRLGYESESIYSLESMCNYNSGNITLALDILEKGIKEYQDSENLNRNYVVMLIVTESYSKAITASNDYLKSHPNNALFHYLKSCAYARRKWYDEAYDCAKKAVELDPNNTKYQRYFGFIASQQPGGMNFDL